MKRSEYIVVSPRDFIHGPYIKCPKCGKNSFGILMICDRHYCRRCRECLYPSGDEPPASYPLPPLDKDIIYIDQFAISNMMKLLNPATKAHRRVEPFWGELFAKLDSLCKLQLIICPDSEFHRHESLLAPFYDSLRRMYELLSGGASFEDHETIWRFQILDQLEIWLGKSKKSNLKVHSLLHGKINAWQETFILSMNMPTLPGLVEGIRASRHAVDEGMKGVFERWMSEKDKIFDDWYEEERAAWAGALIQLHREYLMNYFRTSAGLIQPRLQVLFPNFAVVTFHSIRASLKEHGIKEDKQNQKLGDFLNSPEFREAPFIKISAMLYAAMARRAARGRKKPPNRGFATDVRIVSTLLPYCDAMFIDNEFATFVAEKPLCEKMGYKTKVFSYGSRMEFLEYLDDLRRQASAKHLKKVQEVYGTDWDKPFVDLYKYKS